MTTDVPSLPDADPGMLAAELALGLLDGDDRAAALRRVLSDPDFAREVAQWRERLSGLFDDYVDVAAPPSVAERLDAPAGAADPGNRGRGGWPIPALLTAMAAAVALFFVTRAPPLPIAPPVEAPHMLMVASLTLTDKSGSVPALIDATSGQISVTDAVVTPDGKSAEAWLIGGDGVPRAVGLLAASGPSRITLTPAQRKQLAAGVTIAVSIEPTGGSPTGKPTGPVVAAGKISLT